MKIRDCYCFADVEHLFYQVEKDAFDNPHMRFALFYCPSEGFDVLSDVAGGHCFYLGSIWVYDACYQYSDIPSDWPDFESCYHDCYDSIQDMWRSWFEEFLRRFGGDEC